MAGATRELITRVSQLAWDLRPSILDDYGLDSALTRHIDNVTKRADLIIDYQFISAERAQERLPSSVEVVLYRVTQEALNNVVRHARASRVSVIVIRSEDGVTLMVEDDGCGFSPDVDRQVGESGGLGLTGMRERLALLKGQLMIESTPGEGTSIRASIPLTQTED
jgi:signal transduction histidine kinase